MASTVRHHEPRRDTGDTAPGRVVMFGTYDLGKPRNRQILQALALTGFEVVQVHKNIWNNVEDKSTMGSKSALLRSLEWACACPLLIWRYLTAPKHDFVVVGYPGQFDVILLRLFAWMRRAPVIWDVFISLYDTTVNDRKLIKRGSIISKFVWALEWLACQCADRLVMDTKTHVEYLTALYKLPKERVFEVFVGAESDRFPRLPFKPHSDDKKIKVLFYGQFIPLHGIECIVDAARLDRDNEIEWRIIGKGQERDKIAEAIERHGLKNIQWDEWVAYDDLTSCIAEADVCLGVFGDSGKAGRVIPNKAYQIISSGRPLVTRDSPAMRELVPFGTPGVRLVPPADPQSIITAIRDLARSGEVPTESLTETFSVERISRQLKGVLESVESDGAFAVAPAQ